MIIAIYAPIYADLRRMYASVPFCVWSTPVIYAIYAGIDAVVENMCFLRCPYTPIYAGSTPSVGHAYSKIICMSARNRASISGFSEAAIY